MPYPADAKKLQASVLKRLQVYSV